MAELQALVDIVRRLRGPDGCPWDKSQDLSTMRPYLLEETYEVLEAMDGEGTESISAELGDLLFVVLLVAQIAQDAGVGSLDEAISSIVNKMIVRHPHVFGDGPDSDAPGSIHAWENRKAKPGRSRLAGVPASLPGLLRTHRQSEKAAAIGLDWSNHDGVLAKIQEEMNELLEALSDGDTAAISHEYGDLLMATANLGRHIDVPPEAALRCANDRFRTRFGRLEDLAAQRGLQLGPDTDPAALDALWETVKIDLRNEGLK
jgi:MazG family protein